MAADVSLRRRILRACLLLALVLSCVYAVAFRLAVHALEDVILNNRMIQVSEPLIHKQPGDARVPLPGDPEVYRDEQIPPVMRKLAPGIHELSVGQRVLHVLIRDEAGHRFAVVDDESEFERIEVLVWGAMGVACALGLALASLLGASTATRAVRPLVELADAVKQHRPGAKLSALAMQDEIGVLARALAAYQSQMQGFLAREQLFTGDVSHELRTPLTIMLGAAEVLMARLGDRPELLAVAERIRRTAVETGDRIGALLLLSRAPQDLDTPVVDLAPLLEQELERCRPLVVGKPVRLELRVDAQVQARGRPELMGIAFGNLMRNGCHFTEAGFVRVSLQAGEVLVEDTGSGIPNEIRDQVFKRYVRASDSTPGNGLGLAIVQRVCEHLGWTVTVESTEVGGSRFRVCVGQTYADAEDAADAADASGAAEGAGVRLAPLAQVDPLGS